jgi:hypothetical protein
MTLQTVTVKLPQVLYRRLERAAQATNQPLDAVLLQSIRGNIPPSLDDAPAEMRGELSQLLKLNDDDLWAVASSAIDARRWRRHQRLLHKCTSGALTESEQRELERLRVETDRHVIRKSFALALLKWRGHSLPTSIADHANS